MGLPVLRVKKIWKSWGKIQVRSVQSNLELFLDSGITYFNMLIVGVFNILGVF